MSQVADIQINNEIAIAIHKFETEYRKGPDGTLIAVDMVHYSPQGDNKSVIIRQVDKMSQVLDISECGDNIAFIRANRLWDVVKASYEHWKQNNSLPTNGTPLAAWAGVTQAQADILRTAGLRTVEDIANASDIVIGKTGLANALVLRDQARKYLASEDTAKASAQITTLEGENQELKAQMAEMMEMMRAMQAEMAQDKPKRGRKPAEHAEMEAVA